MVFQILNDKIAGRSIAVPSEGERKVRATQDIVLLNGKMFARA